MKFFVKINVLKIIDSHLDTLKNDNSKKAEFDDYFTFLILPLIFASVLMWFDIYLNNDAVNIIITVLSIFVGLLINVIVLIFDMVKRDAKLKNAILKQLLSNIAFTILLSTISILFTLGTYVESLYIREISNWLVYFCLSVFLLTILMILKRMYILFANEIEEIGGS
jgi:hypothetical protein